MYYSPIAQTIRAARADAALTQEQLATASGVSRSNIAAIELGRTVPNPITRRKLAVALDKPPNWLDILAMPAADDRPQSYYMGYAYGFFATLLHDAPERLNGAMNNPGSWRDALTLVSTHGLTRWQRGYLAHLLEPIEIGSFGGNGAWRKDDPGVFLAGYYAYQREH